MIKIIDTSLQNIDIVLQNYSHSTQFLEWNVNYFENFGAECFLLKIRYNEFSFTKHRGCQCNLSKKIIDTKIKMKFVLDSCHSYIASIN